MALDPYQLTDKRVGVWHNVILDWPLCPRPLSALELPLSGLIMGSRIDTAGDNQNTNVIISKSLASMLEIARNPVPDL